MEKLTPKSDTEQISTNYVESPLISDGRELAVNISIPELDLEDVKLQLAGKNSSWPRRIQKVPDFLRQQEHNKRDYDPAVVSFGPYHHGKPELKFVEDFKPTALALFVEGTGKHPEYLYNMAVEVIQDVRRCYVENSTDKYEDAAFARMMLLDACLLINLIIMDTDMEIVDHLGELVHSVMYRDLYLLENQIPLSFLKLLIYLKFGKEEGEKRLRRYLIQILNDGVYEQTGESNEEEEPLHLLEAYRRILVAHSSKDTKTNRFYISEWISRQTTEIGNACYRHCLPVIPSLGKREKIRDRLGDKIYIQSFRSVTDLKIKGIHFRPSPTDSFMDIQFKSSPFGAKLQLPTWIVNKNTKVFFLNTVAFELSPHTSTNLGVSSYINFIKALIESPKDVKELREKRIIFSTLGSDEEVLRVYKDINTYDVDNVEMYMEVREKIQDHYNSMAKTWVAEFFNTYFRSPWSLIALLAAIFLLCLTLAQTYFTLRPPFDKAN